MRPSSSGLLAPHLELIAGAGLRSKPADAAQRTTKFVDGTCERRLLAAIAHPASSSAANRPALRRDRHGSIHELATFGNVVPTGLETAFGRVFVTQMGPIPHRPEDGKVVAVRSGREPREVANGASMLIDVERGPHGKLYGLSQGQWDGVGEGSRALPDTGRLVVVGRHGDLTPVVDGHGEELVLDRPTSVEFVGDTAYVVSVTGDVYRVHGL